MKNDAEVVAAIRVNLLIASSDFFYSFLDMFNKPLILAKKHVAPPLGSHLFYTIK